MVLLSRERVSQVPQLTLHKRVCSMLFSFNSYQEKKPSSLTLANPPLPLFSWEGLASKEWRYYLFLFFLFFSPTHDPGPPPPSSEELSGQRESKESAGTRCSAASKTLSASTRFNQQKSRPKFSLYHYFNPDPQLIITFITYFTFHMKDFCERSKLSSLPFLRVHSETIRLGLLQLAEAVGCWIRLATESSKLCR